MTQGRFAKYPAREVAVFKRFLDIYDLRPGFRGAKSALGNYRPHPEGLEDYDIQVVTDRGILRIEIQESKAFSKYGDLRLDYVSDFRPAGYRSSNLSEFIEATEQAEVRVEKWGKLVEPKADFLIVEFQNGHLDCQIYSLPILAQLRLQLERAGQFRTNHKQGESWGSAFLAVKETHPVLQKAKPAVLVDILTQAK